MLPHRLYVGTIGEGVWRSLDHGATFTRAADGMFVECHVRALAVHPRDHRVLFLGSEHGLFRSDDGADNWRQVDSPVSGKQVWSICVSPTQPDLILVGTCPPQIFRSDDAGRSWSQSAATLRPECPRILWNRVTTLKADPARPQRFWAGVEIDGVHLSDDGGRSFQPLSAPGLSSQDIHDLAFTTEGALFAATNNDLNRSLDRKTWKPLGIGATAASSPQPLDAGLLPWPYCRSLCRLPGEPEVLLLGTGTGPPGHNGIVGRSVDGGATFRAASMPPANSTIWNFAAHPADPDLVYASSVSGEVYRSVDRGARWERLTREFGEIRALAWTPS